MSVSDPIAHMFTKINNANAQGHEKVDISASHYKEEIVKILKDEGFIWDYRLLDDGRQGILRIFLKYGRNNEKAITKIRKISKLSLRKYCSFNKIPNIFGGLGSVIISTSKGVMTGEKAKQLKLGGEIIGYVW